MVFKLSPKILNGDFEDQSVITKKEWHAACFRLPARKVGAWRRVQVRSRRVISNDQSPWHNSCQGWCRNWATESLYQCFSGCIARGLSAGTVMLHKEDNSMSAFWNQWGWCARQSFCWTGNQTKYWDPVCYPLSHRSGTEWLGASGYGEKYTRFTCRLRYIDSWTMSFRHNQLMDH